MLSLVLGLSLSHAAGLPSIDDALRTGATATADTAVVIGVEDYAFVQDVPYAQRDANAFYDFLVYTRGVPSSQVRLLDNGASKEQIEAAISTAGTEVGAGGTVWVYFAGHGAADPSTGERVLLGDDVKQDPTAFVSRSVSVADVKILAGIDGGAVNLIVDACYSGLGRGGDELLAGKRFLVPAYASAPKAGNLEWNAASGDQLSGPLHPVRHGAFTYLAIGALRGWADGEISGTPDGQVTAEEAHLYVKGALRSLQITDQTPEMSVESSGERVLVKSDKLELGPELDARLATGGAPKPEPVVSAQPTGLVNAADYPLVESLVRGAVQECVDTHAGGDLAFSRWSVRFKVKSGGKLKGYTAALGEYTESPAAWPTLTCVRERVKSWRFTADRTIAFKTAITLETMAQPAPRPQPVAQPAPRPQPVAQPTPAPQPAVQPAPRPVVQPAPTVITTQMPGSTTTVTLPEGLTLTQGTSFSTPPTPQPASGVTLILRSQDGEWFDFRVDGQIVAEVRNEDETRVTISPGTHTLEFVDFMADDPYAAGVLNTDGQTEIVFGVRETGVELYGSGDWSPK